MKKKSWYITGPCDSFGYAVLGRSFSKFVEEKASSGMVLLLLRLNIYALTDLNTGEMRLKTACKH